MGSQIENQSYNRDLQERVFAREDNAVQRRAEDMRAAGINPILAAGSPAQAGSVVRSDAPQLDASQVVQNALGVKSAEVAIQKQKADVSRTQAETRLLNMQQRQLRITNPMSAEKLNLENLLSKGSLDPIIQGLKLKNDLSNLEKLIKAEGVEQAKVKTWMDYIKWNIAEKYSLTNAQTQALAMQFALMEKKYNYDWYKNKDLPSNAGSTSEIKNSYVMQSLINDMMDKLGFPKW